MLPEGSKTRIFTCFLAYVRVLPCLLQGLQKAAKRPQGAAQNGIGRLRSETKPARTKMHKILQNVQETAHAIRSLFTVVSSP